MSACQRVVRSDPDAPPRGRSRRSDAASDIGSVQSSRRRCARSPCPLSRTSRPAPVARAASADRARSPASSPSWKREKPLLGPRGPDGPDGPLGPEGPVILQWTIAHGAPSVAQGPLMLSPWKPRMRTSPKRLTQAWMAFGSLLPPCASTAGTTTALATIAAATPIAHRAPRLIRSLLVAFNCESRKPIPPSGLRQQPARSSPASTNWA